MRIGRCCMFCLIYLVCHSDHQSKRNIECGLLQLDKLVSLKQFLIKFCKMSFRLKHATLQWLNNRNLVLPKQKGLKTKKRITYAMVSTRNCNKTSAYDTC